MLVTYREIAPRPTLGLELRPLSDRRSPARHTGVVRLFRRSAREPSDILVVCTGNVCRSPYIAALLQAELPSLTIRSAGTSAMVDRMPGESIFRVLAERAMAPDLPPARSLTKDMVRGARLIVTASRMHRALVVALDPTASARAFTLKELSRVLSGSDRGGRAVGVDEVVRRAAAAAQKLETVDYDDDLDDPIGQDYPAYQRMAAEVDTALAVLIPALRTDRSAADPAAG